MMMWKTVVGCSWFDFEPRPVDQKESVLYATHYNKVTAPHTHDSKSMNSNVICFIVYIGVNVNFKVNFEIDIADRKATTCI